MKSIYFVIIVTVIFVATFVIAATHGDEVVIEDSTSIETTVTGKDILEAIVSIMQELTDGHCINPRDKIA